MATRSTGPSPAPDHTGGGARARGLPPARAAGTAAPTTGVYPPAGGTGPRYTRRLGVDMGRFLTHWLLTAVALGVAAWILPGVQIRSLPALAVAAVVLGLVNAVVRPILILFTLPITILTLGLFYLVVNGVAFALAAWLVPGFEVSSFGWAVAGALCVGAVSWFVGAVAAEDD